MADLQRLAEMAGYKNFLTTPLNRSSKKSNHRDKAFEFTPIGLKLNHEDDSDSDLDFSALQDVTNKNFSRRVGNNENGVSAKANPDDDQDNTENSFESFQTSIGNMNDSVFNGESSVRNSAKKPNKETDNYLGLLNNTSNPLNQQQELIHSLKRDNYGLKVKVSSLQQYLTDDYSIPENVKILIQENSELKLQLNEQAKSLLSIRNSQNLANSNENHDTTKLKNIMSDQQNEIHNLTSKISDYKQRYSLLEDKLTSVQQRNDVLENTRASIDNVNDLQFEIRNKDQELEQKDLEIDVLQQKVKRLESNQTHDVEDYKTLETDLKNKEEEIEKLNHMLNNLRQDIQRIANEKDTMEVNYTSLGRGRSQLESELSKLNFRLKNKENEIIAMNNKLKKSDEVNVSRSKKIEELNSKITLLTSEYNLNENEVLKLKSYVGSLENQISSNNNYDLEKEIERLRLTEDSLRNEITQYKQYIFELESSKQDILLKDDEFLHEVEKVEKERDAAYDDVQIYENYILDLENKVENNRKNYHIIEDELHKRDEKLAKLNEEIDFLRTKLKNSYLNNDVNNDGKSFSKKYSDTNSSGGFLSSIFGSSIGARNDNANNDSANREHLKNNAYSANATIRKLSEEKDQLTDEMKILNLEIRQLRDKLSTKKNDFQSDYEKQEIKRLYKEVNDLQVKLVSKDSSNESLINEYKDQITKLNTSLNMLQSLVERLSKDVSLKDIEIMKLQKSTSILSKNNKIHPEATDISKKESPNDKNVNIIEDVSSNITELKLLKEKLNLERQLMELEFNNERTERENQRKIDILNEEIDVLKKSLIKSTNSTKLNEKGGDIKHDIPIDGINQSSSLASSVGKDAEYWKTKYNKVKEEFKTIFKKYKAIQSILDQLSQEKEVEIKQLKQEIKIKDEAIDEMKISRNFPQNKNNGNHVKLEELTDELNNLRFDQSLNDYHYTNSEAQLTKVDDFQQILGNKIIYYREKFHKQLYITSDLRFAYQYLKQKLEAITSLNIDDLIKLGKLTPESYKFLIDNISKDTHLSTNDRMHEYYKFGNKKRKLSFKVLAKCILAAIRIKNRWLKNQFKERNLRKIEYYS